MTHPTFRGSHEPAVWYGARYYGSMVDAFTSQLEESNPVPLDCKWRGESRASLVHWIKLGGWEGGEVEHA